MDLTYEIVLWLLGLIIGFILGWLTNWYFYRKQQKETKPIIDDLKFLVQKGDAEIRLGNDKRGKIVKKSDGSIAIDWQANFTEGAAMRDTFEVVVNKKRGDANFEIKHNGKESMTITCKDENDKEIKIEIPWEIIQELRKKHESNF
jgi:hypothetical protein